MCDEAPLINFYFKYKEKCLYWYLNIITDLHLLNTIGITIGMYKTQVWCNMLTDFTYVL